MLPVTPGRAIQARTSAINQLKALVLTAPDQQQWQPMRGLTKHAYGYAPLPPPFPKTRAP